MIRFIKVFVTSVILVIGSAQLLIAQCAMCRATVENNVSYGETDLASGLNLGIMYLFVAPYLLVGAIAFFWYKKSRASNAKKIRRVRHSPS
ncbi:MAG: hypothetical protein WBA23_18160 [Tunicatimonas sp.]|uniref:hypothetical protein n=1 Tax=Tunicatimonas sp. TaxID=1940096 RepID=UPI003C7177EC